MSTPELNNLNYRLVNNLFNKNNLLLIVGMITDFVHWVDKVKVDYEENGIEVLNFIYTNGISMLEKNTQNQISEVMDTTIEMEHNTDNNTDFPNSSHISENNNYEGEFYLEKAVWHVISYLDENNTHRMNKGWTDIIAERFTEINPICVLKFKHHWFKKIDSNNLKSPFFQAPAVCKFPNCIFVTFSITNDPASVSDDIIVNFKSEGSISFAHQDGKTIHARHVSSDNRKEIGAKLIHNSVSNIFHQQFRN